MPEPNPNRQPVEVNRTTLFLGTLLVLTLALTLSSYFYN